MLSSTLRSLTTRTATASRFLLCSSSTSTSTSVINPSTSSTSRSLHSLPALPEPIRDGCEPLLSSTAVNLIGNTWQGGLLKRLNEEVKGTGFENSSLVETVISTSQDKTLIQAFNWASLALNNSFFLSSLKPNLSPELGPPLPPTSSFSPKQNSLSSALTSTYGSLTSFKSSFSSCAMSMTSSGWVWLVTDANGNLGIVPTFGSGTVLVQNRKQKGTNTGLTGYKNPDAMELSKEEDYMRGSGDVVGRFTTSSYTSSTSRKNSKAYQDGDELFPLLCCSVMEHAWLPDYGMWGKERYMINFWDCVDWEVLQRRWEEYERLG